MFEQNSIPSFLPQIFDIWIRMFLFIHSSLREKEIFFLNKYLYLLSSIYVLRNKNISEWVTKRKISNHGQCFPQILSLFCWKPNMSHCHGKRECRNKYSAQSPQRQHSLVRLGHTIHAYHTKKFNISSAAENKRSEHFHVVFGQHGERQMNREDLAKDGYRGYKITLKLLKDFKHCE